MSSTFSGSLCLSIFGQSHSEAIGMTLDGLPAGFAIDFDALSAFLARRAPGSSDLSTPRKEADAPHFLCGLVNGRTCGAPITAIIENTNTRPSDYENLAFLPRPSHADYTANEKYHGFQDKTGGGHFSGRLTAPLCIAGGIALQMLRSQGIEVFARIASIADIEDKSAFLSAVDKKAFPVVDDGVGEKMQKAILDAKNDSDSVGGTIECVVTGLPVGLGDGMFDGMENRLSRLVFAIPGVKGLSFGSGFEGAKRRGSENNDAFCLKDGKIMTKTNNSGGIQGGITNAMPLVFRAAIKPTASIAKQQQSVDLETMQEQALVIQGRHDPCIVPRAVPCVEAAVAIGILDALLCLRGTEGFSWN